MFYEYKWKFSLNFDRRFQNLSQTSTEKNDRFLPTRLSHGFHKAMKDFPHSYHIFFSDWSNSFQNKITLFPQNDNTILTEQSPNFLKMVHSSHNISDCPSKLTIPPPNSTYALTTIHNASKLRLASTVAFTFHCYSSVDLKVFTPSDQQNYVMYCSALLHSVSETA